MHVYAQAQLSTNESSVAEFRKFKHSALGWLRINPPESLDFVFLGNPVSGNEAPSSLVDPSIWGSIVFFRPLDSSRKSLFFY
jgi:hypothetical protein